MAVTRIQQYCPVSDVELADGRALSSRVARDWSRQLNNMKAYSCAPMLILNNTYPDGLITAADNTSENYVARWAPVPFPAYYARIRVAICGRVNQAADQVTLRMYADTRLYLGGDPIVATEFSGEVASTSSVFTSTTNVVQLATITSVNGGLALLDGFDLLERNIYLTLTKQSLDATDRVRIFNIAAWAMPPA